MQPIRDWRDRLRALLPARRPLTAAEMLERQHRRGDYRFLYDWAEIGHQMIALGYLPYLHANPAVLDVGCGQGRWFELLQACGRFRRYVGIDISETAVRQAAQKSISPQASFVTADFETWQTSERFDIILFNESLYFADEPRALLRHYANFLNRKGCFLISIHEHFGYEDIWDDIAADYKRLAGDTVRNERGQVWTVRALRPVFRRRRAGDG